MSCRRALGGADEERNAAEEEKEGASLFIADGAQFRSVATARFPKRAPQLNADAAMTDVKGHGGPMDAKKAQEIKARRARGEKVDATTKDLTWWQRNYMWVIPVVYFMFMNAVQGQPSSGGGQTFGRVHITDGEEIKLIQYSFFITARLHHHTSSDAPFYRI